ncbi:response regulator [Algoriphagus aquatilis]|uniref:Response regulator n=1 Tax=Algoriphagus aquatilis TaxID=490186 RepID=A0ABW0BUK9_9BACT|nr:response regulator [Algoriphagus sp.]
MKTKPKILYVDDEPMNLELFEANFSSLYEVIISTNGYEAFEILQENGDLKAVISDLKMPEINGFDFVAKVKESFPEMKCFLMSGYDFDEQIANAINTGLILSYFMKPFDLNKIRSTLRMYLNE